MSEHEKNTGGNVSDGSSVVMIESAARHKQPYRPTGMHESSPELHHKHSKAPAVPSVAEDLKDAIENTEMKEWKEFERADSSEKYKQTVAKKLSSSTKRRGSSPEAITLAPLEVETKKVAITPSPQPIPAQVSAVVSEESGLAMDKSAASDIEKKRDDDSITQEIETRTPEVVKRSSEWSDDEEASGLPRSDSRASRVSRVVRQLFCCGTTYEASSEHQLSPRGYTNGI